MLKRKRKNLFLITSLLALCGIVGITIFLPPTFLIKISSLNIPIDLVVYILLFLFFYSIVAYIFRSFIHGILVGLFPVVYLIMRRNDLTNPLFFILLAAIFVGLEILLVQTVKKPQVK